MALYPDFAKLGTCFQLESSPGTSTQTRYFNFSQPGYSNTKIELSNEITSDDMTLDIPQSYRNIFKKINSLMYKNTLHAVNNGELMQCRLVKNIEMSNVNTPSGGYYPYQISSYFTRGFNLTTPVAQYGYSAEAGGYFSNVFMYENNHIEPVITPSLSGAIFNALVSGTSEIDFYFTNYGAGSGTSGLYDYVLDYDHLNLRFDMGTTPLTLEDVTLVNNNADYTSVKNKINARFAGKILKVYSAETDTHEDILIIDVKDIYQSANFRQSPNDDGYMPDRITFNTVRGYNSTTIISGSENAQGVGFSKPGQSYVNLVVNSYVLGNQTIDGDYADNLTLEEDLTTNQGLIELLSETLLLQDSTQILGTNEIKVFLQEYLLLEENLQIFNYKTVLVLLNDILVLNEKYNTNIDVTVLYKEVLRFLDDYNSIDLDEFLLFLNEVLQFNDSDYVVYSIGRIIEVLLNDFFILHESSDLSKEIFQKFNQFLTLNNTLETSKNSLLSLSENVNFVDLLKTNQITQQNFEEILLSNCVLMLGDELYECYSLLISNGALTRYDNYNFNSYCYFNNNYYATSKDKLVQLFDNETHDEPDFEAKFKTGVVNVANEEDKTNINNSIRNKQKFLDFATFTLTSKGQVLFSVINDKQEKFTYNLVYRNTDGKIEQTFGTKVRGNFFELELVTNDDLELQDYIIYPTILNKYNR